MKVWILYDHAYPANLMEVYASKKLAEKNNINPEMFMVEGFEVIGFKRRRGKAKRPHGMRADRSPPRRWAPRKGGWSIRRRH